MSFIRVQTPGALNPGVSRPKLYADPILSAGSLMLVDPGNTAAHYWGPGVPASGSRAPNIAEHIARKVIGGTPEVRPQWTLGAGNTASRVKFERTLRGGLHGLITRTPGAMPFDSDVGARLSHPASIIAYMDANPGHTYYASFWHRITRASGETNVARSPLLTGVQTEGTTVDYFYRMRANSTRPNTGSSHAGTFPDSSVDTDTTGLRRRSSGFSRTGGASTKVGVLSQWGTSSIPQSSNPFDDTYPSFVLYRYYLEDLTVSGRSYQEVDALDATQYAARITSPGGDFHGDAFTNVSELP